MNRSHDRPVGPAHEIRLGSQWDLERLAADARDASAGDACHATNTCDTQRLRSVMDWPQAVGADYQGHLWLLRRFGRPTGLGSHERVELVITSLPSTTTVTLNRHVLRSRPAAGIAASSQEPRLFRYDVSRLLEDRNLLSLELEVPHVVRHGAIPGNVSLVISHNEAPGNGE